MNRCLLGSFLTSSWTNNNIYALTSSYFFLFLFFCLYSVICYTVAGNGVFWHLGFQVMAMPHTWLIAIFVCGTGFVVDLTAATIAALTNEDDSGDDSEGLELSQSSSKHPLLDSLAAGKSAGVDSQTVVA